MNKETIVKYEKEFLAWCKGESVLLGAPTSMHDRTLIWREVRDFNDWKPLDTVYVLNDYYSIYRKALAEGKTIQTKLLSSEYPKAISNAEKRTEWIDFDNETNKFMGYPRYYRIKPEEVIEVKELKIKIGDFVRVNPIEPLNQKCIKRVKNISFVKNTVSSYVFDDESCAFEKYVKLWKPSENELCWFRNSKLSKPEESIIKKYSKDLEKNYDLIEPYMEGKLPSWIKL